MRLVRQTFKARQDGKFSRDLSQLPRAASAGVEDEVREGEAQVEVAAPASPRPAGRGFRFSVSEGRFGMSAPVFIHAVDLPDAWFQTLYALKKHGRFYRIQRGSFKGSRRLQLPLLVVYVRQPWREPLIPEIPPHLGIPAPAAREYVEDYFLNYLLGARKAENEQYTYGERIAVSLEKVIRMLRESPATNQAVIEVARPEDVELPDPPCLRLIDFKAVDGELEMTVYFRSWDVWAGMPANLAALELLRQYVAVEAGFELERGSLTAVSSGAHVYDYVVPLLKARLRSGASF